MAFNIKVLSSGSRANCYFIGTEKTSLLIDIGLCLKTLKIKAEQAFVDLKSINGVLITHEHSDHVKGLGVYSKNSDARVYCHEGSYNKIAMKGRIDNYCREADFEKGFCIGDIDIQPFRVSHDARCTVGYSMCSGGEKISLITDTGYISERMFNHIKESSTVLIESNHDFNMLERGRYTYSLKQRIKSDLGHLSNDACAETIVKLAECGTRRFVLCHLSENNNTADMAYATAKNALDNHNFNDADVLIASPQDVLIVD